MIETAFVSTPDQLQDIVSNAENEINQTIPSTGVQ